MWTSPRRADWLTELHQFLKVVTVLTAAGAALRTVPILIGQPIAVTVASNDRATLLDAPPRVTLDSAITVSVSDPTATQIAWELLAGLPGHLLILATLILLWRLIAQVRVGDPFTDAAPSRFRAIGKLLVIAGPLVWVLEFVARVALSATVPPGDTYAPLDLTEAGIWVLCGFAAFAAGEIMRRGRSLRTELDGVV